MTHNNEITNSENDFNTTPLKVAQSCRDDKADVEDERLEVVVTLASFHGPQCVYLPSAKLSRKVELWETYQRVVFPCSVCWSSKFVDGWHAQLRLRHQDCDSQSRLLRPSEFIVRKRETLPPEALRRTLSRKAEGITDNMIVRELMGNGFETSVKAVRRAIDREPPYDSAMFDRLYDAYSFQATK